jgi:hypothetical protein
MRGGARTPGRRPSVCVSTLSRPAGCSHPGNPHPTPYPLPTPSSPPTHPSPPAQAAAGVKPGPRRRKTHGPPAGGEPGPHRREVGEDVDVRLAGGEGKR